MINETELFNNIPTQNFRIIQNNRIKRIAPTFSPSENMTEKRPVGRPRQYTDPFHLEASRKQRENYQRRKAEKKEEKK